MKFFVRDRCIGAISRAHIAREATIWTARPQTLCGSIISPKRWNVADEIGKRRLCGKCRRAAEKLGLLIG